MTNVHALIPQRSKYAYMIGRLKKEKIWSVFKFGTAYLGIRNLIKKRIITQTIALDNKNNLKNSKYPLTYFKWDN